MKILKHLFFLAALFIGNVAFAQKGFHIGVKYQPNLSSVQNSKLSDSVNIDMKSTFSQGAGLTLAFNIFDYLGVQAEAVYSEQGQKYDRTDTTGNTYSNYLKLSYVNLPLLIRMNSSTRKTISFNFTGGIQFGVLTGAGLVVTKVDGTQTTGLSSTFKTLDMAVVYGGGFDVNLDKYFHINLGLRIADGFVDIGETGNMLFSASPAYNKITSIYAGLTF